MDKFEVGKPTGICFHYFGADYGNVEPSIDTIRKIHQQRGYSDIGYHLVIYKSGKVEKGRDLKFIGAHSQGIANHTSIGILVIDDLKRNINDAQKKTMIDVCFDLMKTSKYGNFPNIKSENIKGHRDYLPTQCPGDEIYKYLTIVRQEVKKKTGR